MAVTVKASCDKGCGEVRLKDKDIVVRTLEGEQFGQYRFKCPKCHELVIKNASERIIQVLIEGGVNHEIFTLPLEIMEHPVEAPIINLDDVLDFVLDLQDENWFEKLEGEGSGR